MGSVKDLVVEAEPTGTELGEGRFSFSDAYSVFDWGPMPDQIPDKGASLCTMGAATFEALEAAGIETHYRGVGPEGGSLGTCQQPPRELSIGLTSVPELPYRDGDYDYDAFHEAGGTNYLVPLEIIYRNEVPVGSSLRTRTTPAEHDLDIATWPDHAVELVAPVVEFSTKFEAADRYLDREEATEIAGRAHIDEIEAVATAVNEVVSEMAEGAGMTHLDGKIECCYCDGDVIVADVAGTLDENRFAADGIQLSKEVLRQYHAATDPEWVEAVRAAKKPPIDPGWRQTVDPAPQPLPDQVIETATEMYRGVTNAYVGEPYFSAPPVHALASDVEALAG